MHLINSVDGCYDMSVGWFISDEMLYNLCSIQFGGNNVTVILFSLEQERIINFDKVMIRSS